MSDQNVEIIRRVYDAFNRRDIDAAVRNLHPEYELYPALVGAGGRSEYFGHDGAREFFELITDTWETMTVESTEMVEMPGDQILSVELWRVRGRDGIEIETKLADLYAFRDGLIVRVDGFRDKVEALEAAGLRE
jgi:ketosteroid isomerase-like protein